MVVCALSVRVEVVVRGAVSFTRALTEMRVKVVGERRALRTSARWTELEMWMIRNYTTCST